MDEQNSKPALKDGAAPRRLHWLLRRHNLRWPSKRAWLWIGLGLLAAALMVWAFSLVLATRQVFTPNTGSGAPALSDNQAQSEGDGRINILLLGIGGAGHKGATLSDTVMVVSLDPVNKDVAILSLPRDLYVPITGHGHAKLNAAHAYGESEGYPGGGPALAKETVSKILDLPVHYFARIDFSGFKQGVDAVGGVDITVAKSIYDAKYPLEYDPTRSTIFYLKSGRQHLNGTVALRYARSRYSSSDFDRAARQQQILEALRQKALSLAVLSSPAKITQLLNAAGSHLKTDLTLSEATKLAQLAEDIDASKIVHKVLDTSDQGLLQFGRIKGAGSTVIPRAGLDDFSEIRAYAHSIFIDGYLKREAAQLEVRNASSQPTAGEEVRKVLAAYNYQVTQVTQSPKAQAVSALYDYTDGDKPQTVRYLEQRYGLKAKRRPQGPAGVDIRLVLGNDYKARILSK